jgi:sialidase-1
MMKPTLVLILLPCLLSGCYRNSSSKNSLVRDISSDAVIRPVFVNKPVNELIYITISADTLQKEQLSVKGVEVFFKDKRGIANLAAIEVYLSKEGPASLENKLFGKNDKPGLRNRIKGEAVLRQGNNTFIISLAPSLNPDLTAKLSVNRIRIIFSDRSVKEVTLPKDYNPVRFGIVLRAAGQDNCNTYRIPGLVTTNRGTLIAAYDNRYNRSKDLQEDIDIGMSRSIDGGQTWGQMKVIMDMNKYGGRPENLNGTGDPCILYDNITNTIWVAALWLSGASTDQMVWWASQPGMEPDVTGQLLLVKSTDDGLTWSQPLNITSQVKDPSWQLLLQGPGRGITMKDGTLVFPAQYKADIGTKAIDGGQYTCHSTIICSRDGGNTWNIGTGAKSNTTESQVVELSDGTLMLNMRDDRNRNDKTETNGRAVATTSDLGKTWETHSSSNSALPEPNCMASLISADILINGEKKHVLFFSNPDNRSSRTNMTVKASVDEGISWPREYQIELYAPESYGYSCLTMIDEQSIGILYEGIRELYFQKIPVKELLDLK